MDPNQPVPYGSINPLNWLPPTRDLGLMAHLVSGTPYEFLPAMDAREKARYDRYFAAVQGAAKKAPGERMITASAKDFLEKRAALQGTPLPPPTLEKTALPVAAAEGMLKGPLARILGNTALIGGALLSIDLLGKPLLERLGYKGREHAYSGLTGLPERVRMPELFAEDLAKGFGKELGKGGVKLLGGLLGEAVNAPAALMASHDRENIFNQVRKEDDIIRRADQKDLNEAYSTMVRFAPTLATDKNAVKTFLRESVLYGTGPNPMAIKQLAEAEEAVAGEKTPGLFSGWGRSSGGDGDDDK